jgi:hypothetical protein
MRVGTSFSPRRCARVGLPAQETFRHVLGCGFVIVRMSAHWDEIAERGYAEMDGLLDAARTAQQPIVLTVGMKAIQWPEFYLPAGMPSPAVPRGGRIGRDPRLAGQVLSFISETVGRYRDRTEIVAWQVENEPFNRSGPHHWWIDPRLVRREVRAVRAIDARRPILINTFAHFDAELDSESSPRHGPFAVRRLSPEQTILEMLGTGDVLGLDVYAAIGAMSESGPTVRRADADSAASAARWLLAARARGRDAWIVEAQAEPWEPSHDTYANPVSFSPEDLVANFERLAAAGFSTILLWGCEYWWWRAAAGDHRWLDAAAHVMRAT